MQYIVLDLEWNQAYPEQAAAVQRRIHARLRGEVIQIGAVKLDEDLEMCGSFSLIVKPHFFHRLHRHVARLTGISQSQVDNGRPLSEADTCFRKWCGEDAAFLTWGPDDIPMYRENLRVNGLDDTWLGRVYDLQVLFNQQTDGENRQRSLEFAMERFEIPQNLPPHDALNDAYFTALVAQKLDVSGGVANYRPAQQEVLCERTFGDADIGDDGYNTVGEMLSALESETCPVCPHCRRPLTPGGALLHRNRGYLRLLRCEEHGTFALLLRPSQNRDQTWRCRITVSEATEEQTDFYAQRLAEMDSHAQGNAPHRRRRRRSRKPVAAEEGSAPTPSAEETALL